MSNSKTVEAKPPGPAPSFGPKPRSQPNPWAMWLHDLPARTAFRFTRTSTVSRFLSSRHDSARERHRGHLPCLHGIDSQIVEALRRNGFCTTSLDDLQIADGDAVLRTAQDIVGRYSATARLQAARGIDFILVPGNTIVDHPLLFTWGLSKRLLDIAESYLEVPVGYDGLQIAYTVADGREVSTRRWHRDWEDRRMLKVTIYLNDVEPDGGPMEAIIGPPRHDRDGFDYQLHSDADMEAILGKAHRVTCTGRAGTVILIDTARHYHRGRPATHLDRGALFYSYVARRPRHPFFCERSGLSRHQTRLLSKDLEGRQRSAALWHQGLPALVRLIPSARV